MKVTELREYQIKKGKTAEWLKWMEEELLPYQKSKGMKIISTYLHQDEQGTDYFIWLREFDNEQNRQDLYKSTYNDWWTSEIRPRVFELIEQKNVKVKLISQLHIS